MENNNIRTMELKGVDSWSRPVYKCIETGQLWKDINCGQGIPSLHNCQNDFEGEPDCPIKNSLEVHFKTKYEENQYSFNYQMLDRLRMDCNTHLDTESRYARRLTENQKKNTIEEMKNLWNNLPADKKPEWLTFEQILEYEKAMIN